MGTATRLGFAFLVFLTVSELAIGEAGPGGDGVIRPDKLQLNQCVDIAPSATMSVSDCDVVKLTADSKNVTNINTCDSRNNGRRLQFYCPSGGSQPTFLQDLGSGNIIMGSAPSAEWKCPANGGLELSCMEHSSGVFKWFRITSTDTLSDTLRGGGSSGYVSFSDSVGSLSGDPNLAYNVGSTQLSSGLLKLTDASMLSCDTDIEKLETDGTGALVCGSVPAAVPLPVSATNGGTGTNTSASTGAAYVNAGTWNFATLPKGFGGTGVSSFTADSIFTVDGIGTLSFLATPAGGLIGRTTSETLTNKGLTAPVITTLTSSDGTFNSTLATSGTAFTFNATAGGHTGSYFDFQDNGTSLFNLTDEENIYMTDTAARRGGIYQSNATTTTYPASGTTQPKNIFLQNYTGALAAAKQYSLFYAEVGVKHNNAVSNSDVFGFNAFVKILNNNTYQIRNVTAARFGVQEATYGGGGTINSMVGGDFFTQITQATAAAITSNYAGLFQLQLNSGQNKTITNAYVIQVENGNGTPAAGTTITNWAGLHISDLDNTSIGATNADTIRIESQTGAAADGNIRMVGGAYNTGHLMMNGFHIWSDGTDLFYKSSAPADATDGIAFQRSGAFPPATCNPGTIFIDTDETDDTNCTTTNDNSLCLCTAADTWTALENN